MKNYIRAVATVRRNTLVKPVTGLLLFGMAGVLKASTVSASFSVSMVIAPTCTVSAEDGAPKVTVACVAKGIAPLLMYDDSRFSGQRVVDDQTRTITITY